MKNVRIIPIFVCLFLGLWGCGANTEPQPAPAAPSETVTASHNVESAAFIENAEATTVVTTTVTEVPEETVIPTQAPRVIGPDVLEGKAVTIRDVSVAYMHDLPSSVTSNSTYSFCGFTEDLMLNESQTYAAIRFTVTNQTSEEIKLSAINEDFVVQLIYDDHFVYSTESDSYSILLSGSQCAILDSMSCLGKVTLAPLVTADLTVFIPCAKEVSTKLDKNLSVVFASAYSGYEDFEFVIR